VFQLRTDFTFELGMIFPRAQLTSNAKLNNLRLTVVKAFLATMRKVISVSPHFFFIT
jgi:hypothetical protein